MPLLNTFLENNRGGIEHLSVKQIVAMCGNGELRDGSTCCEEFRDYLRSARLDLITRHAEDCLRSSFTDSGFVLQDLMNELGRRLDFEVANGRYRGVINASGFDGLWTDSLKRRIVVEVKTTDAYRINLDTIMAYRSTLSPSEVSDLSAVCLIIVGRQDTGDLEAQVRGSRHAWNVRIISVDALIRLVQLKENADESTAAKTRELLFPFEYTRLDKIIDLAFTAASEATAAISEESNPPQDATTSQKDEAAIDEPARLQQHTPGDEQERLRKSVLNEIECLSAMTLVKKSRAIYWSVDRSVRAVVSISKNYPGGWYWYGYHSTWDELLSQAEQGFFALGCVGRDFFFALPYEFIHSIKDNLNMSSDADGVGHWHVHLFEEGDITSLKVHKTGEFLDISRFRQTLRG